MIVHGPAAATSYQSSPLVPSCLCFLPRTRAASSRPSSGVIRSTASDSGWGSGSAAGTGLYCHWGPVGLGLSAGLFMSAGGLGAGEGAGTEAVRFGAAGRLTAAAVFFLPETASPRRRDTRGERRCGSLRTQSCSARHSDSWNSRSSTFVMAVDDRPSCWRTAVSRASLRKRQTRRTCSWLPASEEENIARRICSDRPGSASTSMLRRQRMALMTSSGVTLSGCISPPGRKDEG